MSINLELTIQSEAIAAANPPLPSSEVWQAWFQQWFDMLGPDYSPMQSYEVSLILTTDVEIQALNRQYRQQDKPTNVLAFALLDGDSGGETRASVEEGLAPLSLPPQAVLEVLPLELGDIVISVDTAQRQAEEHNHSLDCELAWLASHGLLHLLGWDHPNDERLVQMLDQQTQLLRKIEFAVTDEFFYSATTY